MKKPFSSLYLLYYLILFFSFSTLDAQEKPESLSTTEQNTTNFYTSRYKTQNAFDGLGYYKLSNQTFNYETDKFNIALAAGLLEQNTIFNDVAPGFHGSFSANFEYYLNDRFSFYFFGRYLTPSFNNEERLNNPHMEYIFPQSEVGAGLRGNFNNVNIDVGASTIFGNQPRPNTLLRTKISVGF